MRWPWTKKPDIVPPAPVEQRRNRPFATHGLDGIFDHMDRAQNAIALSIQKPPGEFIALDEAGNKIESHAMDNSMQSAKVINSMGGNVQIQQLEFFGQQGFIGWQMCAILAQHWLIEKVCSMIAKDAVRHGWELTVNDGEKVNPKAFAKIRKLDKKRQLKKHMIEFVKFSRVFGIRHALFLVDSPDEEYYLRPFNIDAVRPGSYRGITQIDPYWLAPELDVEAAANPASKDFYEPTWWRVNGRRVHKSHFVIMRGDEVADILKPSYFYGGLPVTQKVYERVYAAERTANEAPLLAMSKRLTVLKVDLTKAAADIETFNQEMEFFTQTQNNFGCKVIGTGEEEIQQFDTALAGLDETIMTQFQLVAAAGETPATKILGTTPKGFNSSGNYEESSYHEKLESTQENDLTPFLDRHYLLTARSDLGKKDLELDVVWNPVDSKTAAEQADINLKNAQADKNWSDIGAVDGLDVRTRLINDRDSGYNGIEAIVPGGPGDREAEQEAAEAEAQAGKENNEGEG